MDLFSTNELTSLEKTVKSDKAIKKSSPDDVSKRYEIQRITTFITSNNYKTICLQFPDHMLPDSHEVVTQLKRNSDGAVYVMADSNYESCCVDYLTAQHVDADVIIHFGPRCSSVWTETIPCLCIYEKESFDIETFVKKLEFSTTNRIFLKIDTSYLYCERELEVALRERGYHRTERWEANGATLNVYVGENNRNLLNYQLKERVDTLYYYDPTNAHPDFTPYELNGPILRRRNFLIEKIKDSQRVGIIIGTLVIKNFLRAVERVKTLLKLHGKKYYVLSVGRPTVSKLANFPEMDIYVVVCCPSSDIFESRDFYKPIVTLHDVETALNPSNKAQNNNFTYEIDGDLIEGEIDFDEAAPDVSLISGGIRWRNNVQDVDNTDIVVKPKGVVAKNSGEYLNRTFKGLEQKLGETEVKLAEEGRRGVAQSYENELF